MSVSQDQVVDYIKNLKLGEGGEEGRDSDIARETFERTGASVMGKRMFDLGEQAWPEEAPFHTPVFVVTHEKRDPWERLGGTTFHFVNDGIEPALDQAREAARDRDVRIAGGGADGLGPRAGVPGAVGEVAQGVAELPVDVPPELVADPGARPAGDGRHAGHPGQRPGIGVAGAAVAGLGERAGGAQRARAGQAGEDVRVGVGVQLGGDLRVQGPDPPGQAGHGAGQLHGEGGLGGVVTGAGRGGGQPGGPARQAAPSCRGPGRWPATRRSPAHPAPRRPAGTGTRPGTPG